MAENNNPCINCPQEPDCYYPCKERIHYYYTQIRKEKKNAKKQRTLRNL